MENITNEQGVAIYLQQSLSGLTSARLLLRTMYANGEYVPYVEICRDLIRIDDAITELTDTLNKRETNEN